jgi:PHS family inorganic phosphate transporter-like MFS transporter
MGALVVQAILPYIIVDGVKIGDPNSNGLGWIFIIFGFVMALGAPFAWAWIPPLQNTRDEAGGLKLPSKTLEDLGDGVKKLKEHGYPVGFRDRFEPWFHSRRPHSETPPV